MIVCRKCGTNFLTCKKIDGKWRNLSSRKYCLDCSPFGSNNRVNLEKKRGQCIVCEKELVGNQTKFCSLKCKAKEQYSSEKRKIYAKENSESILRRSRKYKDQKKELIKESIGNACIFCEYGQRNISHKKDGEKHKLFSNMGRRELENYLIIYAGEFVCLCFKCHKHVHWCMDHLDMDWDEITSRFAS